MNPPNRISVACVVAFALLVLALRVPAQPDPAPVLKGELGHWRTQKLVSTEAAFHEVPWSADLDPKAWKAKYTTVFTISIPEAKVGDRVRIGHRIMINARGAYDIRRPTVQYPLGCQVNVLMRTLTKEPEKVYDLPPAATEPLGSFKDDLGVWGTMYGEDMTAGGHFKDVNLGLSITIGTPYHTDVGHSVFTVTATPLVIAWYVEPKSQGANGKVKLQLPGGTSGLYSEAWAVVSR